MKGGGFFNLFTKYYSNRIQELEQLRRDIDEATTYGWLEADATKTNRLNIVDEVLFGLRHNKRNVKSKKRRR